MQDPIDPVREGRLDLVPMIDCIMLLLLFFILTTRFVSEDRQIATLLPVPAAPTPHIGPLQPRIDVVLTPADLPRGLRPYAYQRDWDRLVRERGAQPLKAELRMGSSDPLVIDIALLGSNDPQVADTQLAGIHAYLARELDAREQRGPRSNRAIVDIHCFSGLSWGYALAAYDGVRAYDRDWLSGPAAHSGTPDDYQRDVVFAPPRVRTRTFPGQGTELWELQNLR